ncbi:MAG: flagellar biosynthesis protein FlhB [Spirochaetaceae bacterium]|nr:flagellar biosynthesis protein FlhB [Spirochaetaceae bacterium]
MRSAFENQTEIFGSTAMIDRKLPLLFIDLQWFAAEDEGRTEDPTEYKLRKAREEGRVPKSQELNAALVMLLTTITLTILAPWVFRNCTEMMRFFFSRSTSFSFNQTGAAQGFFYYLVKMFLPIGSIALITAIAANLIQNRGFIFSAKPLEPNFSKIIPRFGQYFRRTIFSLEGAFNVAKSIVKVAILFLMSYLLIRGDLVKLLSLLNVNLWTGITHIAWMAAKLLIIAAVFFLVIAVPDYLMQRYQFMEQMKMSKQEVREEFKQQEGDPMIKNRIMQQMQALLRFNLRESVSQADVVITNPTHYAVALHYDRQSMPGPMVMAKGVDDLALRIREIAAENDVPLVEDRPLARALYAETNVGDSIPEHFYTALAIILAQVQSMKAQGLS